MRTHIKNLFTCLGGASRAAWVLRGLAAGLGLMLAGQVTAQTFTTLYSFTGGSDGGEPSAALILSGNTLYGTAGTLFALNTDGTDANRVCHWVVRATANQGASWVTVDDFEYVSGPSSIPHCFGLDAVGDVYVGGFGRDSANVPHWLVRKATP
jgi:hypothetical protein